MSASPFARAIVIVLDSVGVGEMPDAAEYGDAGSNTLGGGATVGTDGLWSYTPTKPLSPGGQSVTVSRKCQLCKGDVIHGEKPCFHRVTTCLQFTADHSR